MGKIIEKLKPCKSCGSSDAVCVYEDHSTFCFSCRKWSPSAKSLQDGSAKLDFEPEPEDSSRYSRKDLGTMELIEKAGSGPLLARKLSKAVVEFFGVKVSYGEDRRDMKHAYPYCVDKFGIAHAYKLREVVDKKFVSVGKIHGLFGQHLFATGGKRLVITEGEIDALSIAQASQDHYKKIYPVVSLRSSTTVKQDLLENLAWIRGFEEVVLCLDNDEAGKRALDEACKIIGVDRVKIADFGSLKDPNEVLVKNGFKALINSVWDAQPFIPAGIMGKTELWEALKSYNELQSLPYPACINGLNEKLRGIRLGEIDLFISGTGAGKSTLFRELILNIRVVASEEKIGIISLEEAPAETARRLSGMQLELNTAETDIPIEQLKVGFDAVFGDDRVLLLDHQGSVNDDSLMNMIEYMALMGCKYIFLDHITLAVSEGVNDLTGNEAIDSLMSSLLKLVKRHNFWLGLISHLRKAPSSGKSFEEGLMPNLDSAKGSGSIKQISFGVIGFARDQINPDPVIRSTINFSVLKNRYTGLTGPVAPAFYNAATGRLQAVEPSQEFVKILPTVTNLVGYDEEEEDAKELAIEQVASFLAMYEGYNLE